MNQHYYYYLFHRPDGPLWYTIKLRKKLYFTPRWGKVGIKKPQNLDAGRKKEGKKIYNSLKKYKMLR